MDVKKGEVVGLMPKPQFMPLFNLKRPIESGEMILVGGDPDGIRTHDLRRDRPIC